MRHSTTHVRLRRAGQATRVRRTNLGSRVSPPQSHPALARSLRPSLVAIGAGRSAEGVGMCTARRETPSADLRHPDVAGDLALIEHDLVARDG